MTERQRLYCPECTRLVNLVNEGEYLATHNRPTHPKKMCDGSLIRSKSAQKYLLNRSEDVSNEKGSQ